MLFFSLSLSKFAPAKFKTLVPLSSSKDNRYIHIQRSVYGTIATHWYCPPDVSPKDYLAYIYGQEHLLKGKGEVAQENLAINLHYFDYKNCSTSQLLCSQIFEMTDKDGESNLYVRDGQKKRQLPSTINSDLIITAVSKLRKSPSMQEWLKLSPYEIDANILAK